MTKRRATSRAAAPPTLLPDPAATLARLQHEIASRRGRARLDLGEGGDASTFVEYPRATNGDVLRTANFVTLALLNDLDGTAPDAAAHILQCWLDVLAEIHRHVRRGEGDRVYPRNRRLWLFELPLLAALVQPRGEAAPPRNGGALEFRPLGGRGEPYPSWVRALKGHSGVYVIRTQGDDGEETIAYVGSSSTDRLYETFTRHFQEWRRWKKYWRGGFSEGADPGWTYPRESSEAAAFATSRAEALAVEMSLIRALRPRDNQIGQLEDDDDFARADETDPDEPSAPTDYPHAARPPGGEEIPF